MMLIFIVILTMLKLILKNEYDKSLEEIDDFDEISNLCESSEDEAEIDEFENAAEKVKCFGETLMPKTKSEEELNIILLQK